MRVSFRSIEPLSLTKLWNSVAPGSFRLTEDRLRTHLFGSPHLDWGLSAAEVEDHEVVSFVAIKQSAAASYRGPDQDVAHIAAFACHECQVGVDLLARAKRTLIDRGFYRLVFGQDSLHLFPGMPDNWPKLHDFLMVEGFVPGSEVFDFVQDLAEFQPVAEVATEVRPIDPDSVGALREFLEKEFPGRWTYDTMMKLEREGRSDFVYGLFLDGRCEGFAVTQDASHRLPIGGAVFPTDLGESWCALGPIGVSRSIRGQGWGDRMLASSLQMLKESGRRMCRVDWTALTDWYAKHGFRVERTYRSMTLRLDDQP